MEAAACAVSGGSGGRVSSMRPLGSMALLAELVALLPAVKLAAHRDQDIVDVMVWPNDSQLRRLRRVLGQMRSKERSRKALRPRGY